MRLGSWKIIRVKKDKLGRPLHPWEEITLDQLAPETRLLIQKMARVSARDFYEDSAEKILADLAPKLRSMVKDQVAAEFESGFLQRAVQRCQENVTAQMTLAAQMAAWRPGQPLCDECGGTFSPERPQETDPEALNDEGPGVRHRDYSDCVRTQAAAAREQAERSRERARREAAEKQATRESNS